MRADSPGGGGGKNGYTAPVKLSEDLADIVGGDEMPRHEVRHGFYIDFNSGSRHFSAHVTL